MTTTPELAPLSNFHATPLTEGLKELRIRSYDSLPHAPLPGVKSFQKCGGLEIRCSELKQILNIRKQPPFDAENFSRYRFHRPLPPETQSTIPRLTDIDFSEIICNLFSTDLKIQASLKVEIGETEDFPE
ncbi:hypothetical protein AVEN_88768-1 [Araneus ventricosus]|uniref:Uncharacterized protein n=1 Tax=Araneus ventricosus TaxID=182803 RepID=A0A4Y2Q7P6_ARAVE|nr:hypothetical protein AVEN_88768-1 [Araneus ventricosus]